MIDSVTSTSETAVAPPPTTRAATAPETMLNELAVQQTIGDPTANQLDKDAFLKLLVAQLKFQDPLNPSDPADFMATTAQFTTIEKLDELTTQGASAAIVNGLSTAGSLVGRTVTFLEPDKTRRTTLVTSAEVIGGEVKLMTDRGPVSMSSLIGIGGQPGVSSTPTTATTVPASTTPATDLSDSSLDIDNAVELEPTKVTL